MCSNMDSWSNFQADPARAARTIARGARQNTSFRDYWLLHLYLRGQFFGLVIFELVGYGTGRFRDSSDFGLAFTVKLLPQR